MKFYEKTMVFEDLTDGDRARIVEFVKPLVLQGTITYPLPNFVTQWLEVSPHAGAQELLIMSTVLPLKLLLSVV